jgi:membrane-bound serine protease (ClpP class)
MDVLRIMGMVLIAVLGMARPGLAADPAPAKAAIITCKGMIDDGLYQSIRRRTESALDQGATYLIYEIGTYGGLVESADNISKYLIFDVAKQAHTVAYVVTEAISAGAMISVSCQDIVMRENSTLGDCAPIALGQKLEGIEREKTESFIRAIFDRAAKANGYPQALLRAMVTMEVEVYKVHNRQTGKDEFLETDQLPTDPNLYDLDAKKVIDSKTRLLTVHADEAREYGIARAVVQDVNGVLAFLAERDGLTFEQAIVALDTNWSEELVRWLNHPAVTGILVTIALIGLYMEFSTPGLGLPGLVAVICFGILMGSKYLIGLANWVEVLLVGAGVVLLLIEILVLPGFGIPGIIGVVCLLGGLFGMLVKNAPNRLPWPQTAMDWDVFVNGALGLLFGLFGFTVFAAVLGRYLPRLKLFSGLVLVPGSTEEQASGRIAASVQAGEAAVRVGDIGVVVSTLRPAGSVRFGQALVDCVAQAEFLEPGTQVRVAEVHGNRVVVMTLPNSQMVK